MVIKKKRIYKKQKGGEPIIMKQFFDLIKEFIINKSTNNIRKLLEYINEKIKYSLFLKLRNYLESMLNFRNTYDMISLQLIKYLLVEPEMSDKFFIDKFLKIYIHLLFIRYLFDKNNSLFKNKILTLLEQTNKNNKLIPALLILSNSLNSSPSLYIAQLEQKLHNLFLHDYSREYGIPVFYGGLLFDSQYNEFVCRQVGASSTKKRNFIINPVFALAYDLFYKLITKEPEIRDILDQINRLPKINQSSQQLKINIQCYETFNKLIVELFIKYFYIFKLISFVIQNFNSKRENNSIILRRLHSQVMQTPEQILRNEYEYLYSKVHVPKLSHVSRDSPFCIVLNQFGIEEIIEYSRFSKCAWTYGCNLKMTPVIRDENISSMDDILSLAQILLLIVLTHGDNIFMDVPSVSEFLVQKYIELFYKKLDGQPTNGNINLIKNKLNIRQIKTLVITLCLKYMELFNQLNRENTVIITKIELVREEIKKYFYKEIQDLLLKYLVNELIKKYKESSDKKLKLFIITELNKFNFLQFLFDQLKKEKYNDSERVDSNILKRNMNELFEIEKILSSKANLEMKQKLQESEKNLGLLKKIRNNIQSHSQRQRQLTNLKEQQQQQQQELQQQRLQQQQELQQQRLQHRQQTKEELQKQLIKLQEQLEQRQQPQLQQLQQQLEEFEQKKKQEEFKLQQSKQQEEFKLQQLKQRNQQQNELKILEEKLRRQ